MRGQDGHEGDGEASTGAVDLGPCVDERGERRADSG